VRRRAPSRETAADDAEKGHIMLMNTNCCAGGKLRRAACRFAAAALTLVLLLLPLSGCAKDNWEGEWNRTGDATYSRAEMTITDAGGSGFEFSITLYNGGVVGQVTGLSATYDDSSKLSARCTVPNTRAYIDFVMDEYGNLDVTYGYVNNVIGYDPTYGYPIYSTGLIESEIFGFTAPAYITGHYERGEITYLNQTLYDAAILTAEEDERVRDLMPDSMYMRLMDCFQIWKISNGRENVNDSDYDPHSKKGKHEDEIGAYVYYGSNTMQEYAAMVIIYDDGTASVVVSTIDSDPVYYSSNAIYKDGSLTPLPVQDWLENYNKEQSAIAAAAQ